MHITVFSDELGLDVHESVPIIKDWGANHIDLRAKISGKSVQNLEPTELDAVKELLKKHEMSVACLESPLGKVHLPDAEKKKEDEAKLDGLLRAADTLGCRLVRAFYHWQPKPPQRGALATDDALFEKVIESFLPIAQKAHDEGLILAFENCGCHTHETHRIIKELHRQGVNSCGQAWDVFHSFEEKPRDLRSFVMANAAFAKIIHVKAKRCTFLGDETAIPYTDIFRMVHAYGFRGPVAIETHNHDQALDNVEASHRLYRAVRAALVEASILE